MGVLCETYQTWICFGLAVRASANPRTDLHPSKGVLMRSQQGQNRLTFAVSYNTQFCCNVSILMKTSRMTIGLAY